MRKACLFSYTQTLAKEAPRICIIFPSCTPLGGGQGGGGKAGESEKQEKGKEEGEEEEMCILPQITIDLALKIFACTHFEFLFQLESILVWDVAFVFYSVMHHK